MICAARCARSGAVAAGLRQGCAETTEADEQESRGFGYRYGYRLAANGQTIDANTAASVWAAVSATDDGS